MTTWAIAGSAGASSQAGYTLLEQDPVVTSDIADETRFVFSAALQDAGLACALESGVS